MSQPGENKPTALPAIPHHPLFRDAAAWSVCRSVRLSSVSPRRGSCGCSGRRQLHARSLDRRLGAPGAGVPSRERGRGRRLGLEAASANHGSDGSSPVPPTSL